MTETCLRYIYLFHRAGIKKPACAGENGIASGGARCARATGWRSLDEQPEGVRARVVAPEHEETQFIQEVGARSSPEERFELPGQRRRDHQLVRVGLGTPKVREGRKALAVVGVDPELNRVMNGAGAPHGTLDRQTSPPGFECCASGVQGLPGYSLVQLFRQSEHDLVLRHDFLQSSCRFSPAAKGGYIIKQKAKNVNTYNCFTPFLML